MIFRQRFGRVMGNPLSPVMAGLFMEYFKSELLPRTTTLPHFGLGALTAFFSSGERKVTLEVSFQKSIPSLLASVLRLNGRREKRSCFWIQWRTGYPQESFSMYTVWLRTQENTCTTTLDTQKNKTVCNLLHVPTSTSDLWWYISADGNQLHTKNFPRIGLPATRHRNSLFQGIE